jgi:beta-galactosidase/beta-glucuronidase
VHRVQKLKDMGMNGWRTAHNAPNPALLDAADRMGFLDENHRNGQQDDELTTLVLRDRNHPTIVLWSVCNELLCETPSTDADFTRSVALFHALDPLEGALCQVTTTPSTDRTRHWTCKVREGKRIMYW